MPLIPALGRQRQVDFSEFKASLVYRVSSRTVRTVTQRNPVSTPHKDPTNQSYLSPNTLEAEAQDCLEFKASFGYLESSRISWARWDLHMNPQNPWNKGLDIHACNSSDGADTGSSQ